MAKKMSNYPICQKIKFILLFIRLAGKFTYTWHQNLCMYWERNKKDSLVIMNVYRFVRHTHTYETFDEFRTLFNQEKQIFKIYIHRDILFWRIWKPPQPLPRMYLLIYRHIYKFYCRTIVLYLYILNVHIYDALMMMMMMIIPFRSRCLKVYNKLTFVSSLVFYIFVFLFITSPI